MFGDVGLYLTLVDCGVMLCAEEAFENEMWYTRVLALNDRGAFVLKKAKEKAGIKILNNINKEEKLPELFKYDIMASDIYNIITGKDMYKNSDFVMKPYIMLGDNTYVTKK